MKKNVLIKLKGNNHFDDETDTVEMVTNGELWEKNNKYYLTYKEDASSGFEDTTTTLKIEKEKITLMRFGQNNSQMVFENGKKHLGHYETQFGSFTIGILTNKININISDNGGEIDLKYGIEIDHRISGENGMFLSVTPH